MRPSSSVLDSGARSLPLFALFCFALWTLASLLSRWVGIWPAVGSVGILLGLLSLAVQGRLLLPNLRPHPALVLVGCAAAVVMVTATYLLYWGTERLPLGIPTHTELLYARFREFPTLGMVLVLPLCVVAEELVWRGVVQEAFTRRYGQGWGVALGAVAYALSTVPTGSALLPVIAIACGLYWGMLRAGTRSLVAPLICHMVWDVIVFSVFPLVR